MAPCRIAPSLSWLGRHVRGGDGSVDPDVGARDERGPVGGEEERRLRDLPGLAEARQFGSIFSSAAGKLTRSVGSRSSPSSCIASRVIARNTQNHARTDHGEYRFFTPRFVFHPIRIASSTHAWTSRPVSTS